MQRTYLKCGDTLELNNRTYIVVSKVGDGATCAVYSAEYKDGLGLTHKVNIKECYPYNASVCRDGNLLNWEADEERTEAINKFKEAYVKLLSQQDANEASDVFDICEYNNTIYLVMEPNKRSVTYDKYKPESLGEILRSIKRLASYIGDYHNNGYLHLDIKPDNFMIVPSEPERITLFDMDTITAISDIESGNYKYLSYSDRWAAPEQKQGKVHKLCPATDIFAIGAVLFEKVMGRQFNIDDIGYFAEWDFIGDLFENINPKIKRLLTNIFKKTLAASVKRRYQSADALVKDLDKAIKIAESEVYLKGDDVCCSGYFVGRDEELKKIKDSFDSKKKAVFLHGFGGIGKTEIARKYAEIYKKDYDVILFVKHEEHSSIFEKLSEVKVANYEAGKEDKVEKIYDLLDGKTLVIIDNFDVETKKIDELKGLFNSEAKILISTRTDFSSIYSGDKYTQIEIKELASDELEQVFLSNAKIEIIKENEKEVLRKIFKLIQNHTYATELLAKQMYYSGWSFETLYNKVKSGFSSFSGVERIVTNKDEDTLKDNSLNILRAVFKITGLSDAQKQVLRNLYLLRFMNVNKCTYTKYTLSNSINMDDMNDLVEIGLVKFNGIYYMLHPLVEELVNYDLKPNSENCVGVYSVVDSKIFNTANYDGYGEADEFEFGRNCEFLCAFFYYVDLCNKDNRTLLIKWLLELHQNENITLVYNDYDLDKAYEKLVELTNSDAVSNVEKSDMFYILVNAWLSEFNMLYGGNSEFRKSKELLREEKIIYYYKLALNNCLILEGESKTIHLDRLVERIITFAMGLIGVVLPKFIIEDLYNKFPEHFNDVSISDKNKIGLSLSNSEYEELMLFQEGLPDAFKPGYTNDNIDLEQIITEGFHSCDDKVSYFHRIINDENYTPMKKAELMSCCTDTLFHRLHMGWQVNNIDKYDWVTLEKILEMEEEFLISDECNPSDNEESHNWKYYLDNNGINQIIVYAAMNDISNFISMLEFILEDIKRKVSWKLQHGFHWSRVINISGNEFFSIRRINYALESIKKSHLILPVLIDILEKLENYVKNINEYDERNFFEWYKTIAECAESASIEEVSDPKYEKDYYDIEYSYRDKMDSIAGVDYSLKFND